MVKNKTKAQYEENKTLARQGIWQWIRIKQLYCLKKNDAS
jgi:hypothetical protein